jgi:hypothetical protein
MIGKHQRIPPVALNQAIIYINRLIEMILDISMTHATKIIFKRILSYSAER